MTKVMLYDSCNDTIDHLNLTESQLALLKWLFAEGYFGPDITYEIIEETTFVEIS